MRRMKFAMVLLAVTFSAGTALGDIVWYTDQAAFEAACVTAGYTLDGIETFEEAEYTGNMDYFDDPLEYNIPNSPDGYPYANGLQDVDNLTVQSNTLGGNPDTLSPCGYDGLHGVKGGYALFPDDVVLAYYNNHSLDLIVTNDHPYAMGFRPVAFTGPAVTLEVRAYDMDNIFMGSATTTANMNSNTFVGLITNDPIGIGRMNIYNGGIAEGGDNVQMWTPEPGTLSLLALGGVALLRRRR